MNRFVSVMPPCLVIAQGPEKGESFPIEAESAKVGRDPSCNIVLTDAQVSRQHLRVFSRGKEWFLEDLRSSNGTLLNGRQIQVERLLEGDIIIMGETMMGFHLSDDGLRLKPGNQTQTISLDEPGMLQDWSADEDTDSSLRARRDLEALYRVGRRVNGILKTTQLLPTLLDLVFEEIGHVQRSSIFLLNSQSQEFRRGAARDRSGEVGSDSGIFSSTMAQQVIKEKAAVLTYDALTDERFSSGDSVHSQGIHSAICAPLQTKDRLLGVIYADSTTPRNRFTRDDLRLMAAIGLQAGSALESAQLYERLAYDKAALHVANEGLKSTRGQLIQSEKLAAVGRLASGIVHDMKNPLTVIRGYAGLIRSKVNQRDSSLLESLGMDELLGEIESGVDQVNSIITQLLIFSRPSSLEKKPLSVGPLVESTVSFLKHETTHAGIEVVLEFSPTLPEIAADSNQLKQVFMNIILNATQAMELGMGRLSVGAERVTIDGKDFVDIWFQDNGTGMTEEQKDRIFEPFFTTKKQGQGPGGSGLGLSVSYGIIQNHGGRIAVESELGSGTVFRIAIPVADRASMPSDSP